ncbi:hypothetical protein U9M48_013920 [Paspalum notatum var. saurae]|uniref:Uncharacterized protein n=1 Tax=Paspalum notatum var. saurae TaxID=547442 RepID=A0AAQ3WK03_PASNO
MIASNSAHSKPCHLARPPQRPIRLLSYEVELGEEVIGMKFVEQLVHDQIGNMSLTVRSLSA